jgi:hypothetical protein
MSDRARRSAADWSRMESELERAKQSVRGALRLVEAGAPVRLLTNARAELDRVRETARRGSSMKSVSIGRGEATDIDRAKQTLRRALALVEKGAPIDVLTKARANLERMRRTAGRGSSTAIAPKRLPARKQGLLDVLAEFHAAKSADDRERARKRVHHALAAALGAEPTKDQIRHACRYSGMINRLTSAKRYQTGYFYRLFVQSILGFLHDRKSGLATDSVSLTEAVIVNAGIYMDVVGKQFRDLKARVDALEREKTSSARR